MYGRNLCTFLSGVVCCCGCIDNRYVLFLWLVIFCIFSSRQKFVLNSSLKIPPHLVHVATLFCTVFCSFLIKLLQQTDSHRLHHFCPLMNNVENIDCRQVGAYLKMCYCLAIRNSLPITVLSSDSVAVFKSRLKTFLFSQAFSSLSAH